MKTSKNKVANLLKIGVLFFGISFFLWNCSKENFFQEQESENSLSVPSIELAKSSFLKESKIDQNNGFLAKNNKPSFNNKILWKASDAKVFKEETPILYTPFSLESFKAKTFIASVELEETIDNKIFTLVYDDNYNGNSFSGSVFIHNSSGIFIKGYKYIDGIGVEVYVNKKKEQATSAYSKAQNCGTTVADIIWAVENGYPISNILDCIEITAPGFNNQGEGWATTNNGKDTWYSPDNDLGNENFPNITGEGNINNQKPWWSTNNNCSGGKIYNTSTNQCKCPDGSFEGLNGTCMPEEDDDKIINKLTGKAKCVYDKLQQLSGGFKNMIQKFDGEFPVSHLKFEEALLSGTRKGRTIAPNSTAVNTSPDYVITIQINSSNNAYGYIQRPNLLVAKTIAHEVIHAEMYRKLLSVLDNGGNIDGVTRQDVLEALDGNYPGMYDYYRRHKNWQHAQMATHYREILARMLQGYDTGIAVADNQQPAQLYMDLAWEGLIYENAPNAIPTWTSLPETENKRIRGVISNYITNNQNETCTE